MKIALFLLCLGFASALAEDVNLTIDDKRTPLTALERRGTLDRVMTDAVAAGMAQQIAATIQQPADQRQQQEAIHKLIAYAKEQEAVIKAFDKMMQSELADYEKLKLENTKLKEQLAKK